MMYIEKVRELTSRKKCVAAIMIAALVLMLIGFCGCLDDEGGDSGLRKANAGLSIQVDESTGAMSIDRPTIKDPAPMSKKDTWTIFVYLCGSDLESRILFGGGMGTADIKEMCSLWSMRSWTTGLISSWARLMM